MTTPIKTNYLNAIKTAIEEITLIKKVIRNGTEFNREVDPNPWCSIFDEEEINEDRNQICIKNFPLHIEIWIEDEKGFSEISDRAEEIRAEIHNKLIDNKTILQYGMNLKEGSPSSTKFYAGDNLGGIIIRYSATYSHKRANMFDIGK